MKNMTLINHRVDNMTSSHCNYPYMPRS